MSQRRLAAAALGGFGTLMMAVAPVHAGLAVPVYNSNANATYTLYLDFGGFSYNGSWGNTGKTPGVVPAYTVDGNSAAFTTSELNNIREVWARTAEKYAGLSVNVTTVDPAVAAGQAGTDADRQAFYDNSQRVMHTVIGGTSAWYASAGGVSYVGVAQESFPDSGYHTNWVFPNSSASNLRYLAEAAAHENGHALTLSHQSDYNGTTLVSEYSSNGGSTGSGTYAPIMGNSYSTQRGLWRVGKSSGAALQNDYGDLGSNNLLSLQDDGNAHTLAAARALPLTGTSVSSAGARGVITPSNLDNPNPIGVENYTKDYFHFFSPGLSGSLTLVAGGQNITIGSADPGATFDGTLKIYNNVGALVATATRSTDTLSNTIALNLPVGNYTAEIANIGGYASTFDTTAKYYTSGSYFLRGSGMYTRFNLSGLNFTRADFRGQSLVSAGLASANLTSANLSSVSLISATLTGANLTAATIDKANFTSAIGFTSSQLYTTASYGRQDLSGITFSRLNMAGWNLASQNLASTDFTSSTLTGANFTAADLRGAVLPAASSLTSAIFRNSISQTGVVSGLNLVGTEALVVRDNALGVTVSSEWAMSAGTRLELRLADLAWTSTVASAVRPTLGGTLALTLEPTLDPLSLAGASFRLFDWSASGLLESDHFAGLELSALPSGYRWNLTDLYGSGVVSVSAQPGDFNLDGVVDAADYTVWADLFGTSGANVAGDGNHDGVVNGADYTVWADHFGQGAPAGLGAVVPEPAGMGGMGIAMMLTAFSGRRRR